MGLLMTCSSLLRLGVVNVSFVCDCSGLSKVEILVAKKTIKSLEVSMKSSRSGSYSVNTEAVRLFRRLGGVR